LDEKRYFSSVAWSLEMRLRASEFKYRPVAPTIQKRDRERRLGLGELAAGTPVKLSP
jgi:hypothetical protein